MANAVDAQGTVFQDESVTMLARVVGAAAANIAQSDISSALYSVYLIGEDDPDSLTVISGHEDTAITVSALIYDSLQTDDLWSVDSTGYNFAHILDVSSDQAFAIAGREYLVRFRLTPTSGQIIPVRFRFRAI